MSGIILGDMQPSRTKGQKKSPRQYYKSYLAQICFTGSSIQMGLPKICGLTSGSLGKDFEKYYIYKQALGLFVFFKQKRKISIHIKTHIKNNIPNMMLETDMFLLIITGVQNQCQKLFLNVYNLNLHLNESIPQSVSRWMAHSDEQLLPATLGFLEGKVKDINYNWWLFIKCILSFWQTLHGCCISMFQLHGKVFEQEVQFTTRREPVSQQGSQLARISRVPHNRRVFSALLHASSKRGISHVGNKVLIYGERKTYGVLPPPHTHTPPPHPPHHPSPTPPVLLNLDPGCKWETDV